MKKLLALTVTIIFTVSACGLFSKKEEVPQAQPDEIKLETLTGLVSRSSDNAQFVLVSEAGQLNQ